MEQDKVIIREYKSSDIPELTKLWHEIFYDDVDLIGKFFKLLPGMGTGFVADDGGRPVGMAFVLNHQIDKVRLGYLYAVAVRPEYRSRGIGADIIKHCARHQPRLCTFPASPSLYYWYGSVLGMNHRCRCRYEKIMPEDSEGSIRILSAEEYAVRRSEYKPQVRYPMGWYEYQRELCRTYGGGMFAYGKAIACGYIENGVLKICECLGSSDFIPMLCYRLEAQCAEVRRVSFEGDSFICSNYPIPDTLEFGLALD